MTFSPTNSHAHRRKASIAGYVGCFKTAQREQPVLILFLLFRVIESSVHGALECEPMQTGLHTRVNY
jgi:hypothetical protein